MEERFPSRGRRVPSSLPVTVAGMDPTADLVAGDLERLACEHPALASRLVGRAQRLRLRTQLTGPAATLFNQDAAILDVLVPNGPIGAEMEFRLTVTDDHGETSSDFASVWIIPEPSTGLLVAFGMIGLAGRRRLNA